MKYRAGCQNRVPLSGAVLQQKLQGISTAEILGISQQKSQCIQFTHPCKSGQICTLQCYPKFHIKSTTYHKSASKEILKKSKIQTLLLLHIACRFKAKPGVWYFLVKISLFSYKIITIIILYISEIHCLRILTERSLTI